MAEVRPELGHNREVDFIPDLINTGCTVEIPTGIEISDLVNGQIVKSKSVLVGTYTTYCINQQEYRVDSRVCLESLYGEGT